MLDRHRVDESALQPGRPAARARVARVGCTLIGVETGAQGSEPGASLRGLRRVGLEPLHERTGWTWRRSATSSR